MRRISRLRKPSSLVPSTSALLGASNSSRSVTPICGFSTAALRPATSSHPRRRAWETAQISLRLRQPYSSSPTKEDKIAPEEQQVEQQAAAEREPGSKAKAPSPEEEQDLELQRALEAAERDVAPVEEYNEVEEYEAALPVSDLVVPGPIQIAPRPDQVADSTYTPAESGDGLEEVGGITGWWEDDSHWDASMEINTFGPAQKVTDPAVLEVMARRAVIEALAVRDHSAGSAAEGRPGLTGLWERGRPEDLFQVLETQLEVTEDGAAKLSGNADSVVAVLAREPAAEGPQEDVIASEETPLDASQARELISSWDSNWKRISLEDLALKFAVTKRILQLTGHVIPDAKLPSIHSVQGLLAVLVKPPKPKKLAEEIQARGDLPQLPNVAVFDRRVTPIDKHKMVGRWKVIVRELEKRELPVTGTGKYGKTVEGKWI